MWRCGCGAINEDVQEKCHSCGAAMKPIELTTHKEETTTSKRSGKQKIRVNIVGLMAVSLIVITFYAFRRMDSIPYDYFTTYVGKCFETWAISLVFSELVIVVGGFLLYLLRE